MKKENPLPPVDCSNNTSMVGLGLRVPELNVDRTIHRKTESERNTIRKHISSAKNKVDIKLKDEMLKSIVNSEPKFNIVLK